MKVVLDLTKLLNEGKITKSEYTKLSQLAMQSTNTLAFNLLVAFGIIAVSLSSIALIPTPITAVIIGILVALIGYGLLQFSPGWQLLARMCIPIGSLMLGGGLLWLDLGSTRAFALITAIFAVAGIVSRQGVLIILAVLSLSATIGAAASYDHAEYILIIQQPTITILVFALMAFVTYQLSFHVPLDYKSLPLTAARTSVFLVNFGFWVGSLWGDHLKDKLIPDYSYAIAWAIALIAVAVWAVKINNRWVLNICAVFGAILFFTQWFERLGATPGTVLIAGILALVFALGLKQMNTLVKARK